MALSVPSRFSVLKIEDDDFKPVNSSKHKEKKKNEQKQNNKKNDKQGPNKKLSKQPPKAVQPKKEKKKKDSTEQWEQWKQKDHELVDGTFEQDLHNAILLSKLDYEEHKDSCKVQEQKPSETQNKKKKNKAMSLEQFNNLVTNSDAARLKTVNCNGKPSQTNDDQFFERIRTETKVELNKELTKTIKKDRKSFNNDTITIAQLQEKLESLKVENGQLRSDLEKSRKEIVTVKTRNKTLCGILAAGEMKDKADILMEVEKLNRVKDELTEEITRLNGLLEQERSKVGALTAEPHTHNHKKEKNYRKKTKA